MAVSAWWGGGSEAGGTLSPLLHWRVSWCFPAQQQGQALAPVCCETAGAGGLAKGSTMEPPGRAFGRSP